MALIGVGHLALPEDAALEVAVLPDQVIAAAGVLGEALGVVRLWPQGDGVAGGEVGGVQEAAVAAGAVVAPVAAVLLDTAHLLAGGEALLRQRHRQDDLMLRVTGGH